VSETSPGAGRSLWSAVPTLDALHALNPLQQPTYDTASADRLNDVVGKLRKLPPLVFAAECDKLRTKMASVAAGEAFILQGGDCAETFDGVTAANIQGKLRTLLSMAVVLTYAAQVPIVKIGRMAGQFAKPRSADTETVGTMTLPVYRGDIINAMPFDATSREKVTLMSVESVLSVSLILVAGTVKLPVNVAPLATFDLSSMVVHLLGIPG